MSKEYADIRPLASSLAHALNGEVEVNDNGETHPSSARILISTGLRKDPLFDAMIYLTRAYNSNKVTAGIGPHGIPAKAWNQYRQQATPTIGFDAEKDFDKIHADVIKRLINPGLEAIAQGHASAQAWLDQHNTKERFRDYVATFPGCRTNGLNAPFMVYGTDPAPYFQARIQGHEEMHFDRLTLKGDMLIKVLVILSGLDVAALPAEMAGSPRFRANTAGWKIAEITRPQPGCVNYLFANSRRGVDRWVLGTDDEGAAWETLAKSESL